MPKSDNLANAIAPSRPNRTPEVHGKLETWLAFAFGVIFVSVMLYLAAVTKNPEPLTVKIYLTVLALAAAGVGAILPGFMEVRYKAFFRAGGSLALFALVYLNAPAIGASVVRVVIPKANPLPVVDRFFQALDSGDPLASWNLLAPAGKAQVDDVEANWEALYKNAREPLGQPMSRQLVGEFASSSTIPGMPPGAYKSYTYKTKFRNDSGQRAEVVIVRGNEHEEWEIYQYQVSMATFN